MISHLNWPKLFRLIVVCITVQIPISGAAYGQITQIIGPSGDGVGNILDRPRGIAADGPGNVFVTGRLSNNAFKITAEETVGTATEEDHSGIPTSYALHGNYPNPFNPATTIQIDLPEPADVRLAVYDVLGHEVLRLETPAFSQSRRMLLLK